jgi:hypothetical protein
MPTPDRPSRLLNPQITSMFVIKRDHGTGVEKKEPVSFDRITERIVGLAHGNGVGGLKLSEHVDAVEVAQKVPPRHPCPEATRP